MKIRIEHDRRVVAYNIKGQPIQVEDRYYFYFWKWFKRKYISFQGYCGNIPVASITTTPSSNVTEIIFSVTDKFHARWYLKRETEYILRDIERHPDKYKTYYANIFS